jgi:hypothetical protein
MPLTTPTTMTKTHQILRRMIKMWSYRYLAAPGAVQTTLAFKVEQSKILEYFGQKGKDNITAIVFIRKIEDLARTNRWNDTTTYANVANNLKGFARDWLFATAEMLDCTPAQLTWTNLKPRFQCQFATQTDEKMSFQSGNETR